MLSSLSFGVKIKQYFVSSSDMLLDKKTLLKIWLNPELKLTIFRGTGPGIGSNSQISSIYCVLTSSFHANIAPMLIL